MNRRPAQSVMANPVLIGSVAVLVVIVAVFLSYNANNGLPFVPAYELDAQLPNASGLIKGNEVRSGGARIGVVSRIEPLVRDDGAVGATVRLKLDDSTDPIPVDSVLRVRPRSPLGLKYIELTRGHAARTFSDGATIPLPAGAKRPVEIDDFFNMFDDPTRAANAVNLTEFGNAFAGRGGDLNAAFGGLGDLARHAEPALRNLTAPRTAFEQLFPAFEQAAGEVAPVAEEQGQLFASLSTTFEAWAGVRDSVQAAISEGPEALDTAIRELPAQARFVDDSAELFRRLRPAFGSLAHASPGLDRAFAAGTPALRRSPALNGRVVDTLEAIEAFAADPRVSPALRRLSETAVALRSPIHFVTPAQTTCNLLALFFRNLGSALSESDDVGSFLRFSVLALPQNPDSEAGPAAAPANGPPTPTTGSPAEATLRIDSYLHSNPYPDTAAPGQVQECEAGNERYRPGVRQIGGQPGSQGLATTKTGTWRQAR